MENNKPNTNQQIAILSQYTKDLSFESPNVPQSFMNKNNEAPKIEISLNVSAKTIDKENDTYEVTIEIVTNAKQKDDTLFVVELAYSGLFSIKNFNDEQKELILLIHCPTLLFPFARRIVSDATRDGGFQPLLIDPVDFNALYQNKKKEKAN